MPYIVVAVVRNGSGHRSDALQSMPCSSAANKIMRCVGSPHEGIVKAQMMVDTTGSWP
jgi:hypothetical protein